LESAIVYQIDTRSLRKKRITKADQLNIDESKIWAYREKFSAYNAIDWLMLHWLEERESKSRTVSWWQKYPSLNFSGTDSFFLLKMSPCMVRYQIPGANRLSRLVENF